MITERTESRRLVERPVTGTLYNKKMRVDDFIDRLRKEITLVRREDPSLAEYHLHDVTLSFQNDVIMLHIDFRR